MDLDNRASIAESRRGFARMVLATAFLVSTPAALAQGSDAKTILKATSDYVSSQKTIEFAFDSDIEVVTPQLEKIQFTNSGDVLVSRPDKLRANRVGGYAEVALYFDGKTVSVFGKSINGYAQFDAPGTLDQLFDALRIGPWCRNARRRPAPVEAL